MNELIRVTENNGRQAVSARELHQFLEINTRFDMWAKRMIEYGFTEGIDFCTILSESTGGRPSIDYALTLDTAKHWSMMQRNEKGMQARNYFIEVEKRATKPLSQLDILAQSVQILQAQEKRMQQLEINQEEIKEKVAMIEAKTTLRPNYFTIVGYATLHKIQCGLSLACRLGRKAAAICKNRGIEMEEIPDPRFGKVKTYPETILREVFEMPIN